MELGFSRGQVKLPVEYSMGSGLQLCEPTAACNVLRHHASRSIHNSGF